jgi:hypothetical protein
MITAPFINLSTLLLRYLLGRGLSGSEVDLATRMVYQAMSSPSLENMAGAPPSLPSSRYQASIYSVHSSSYAYRNNSLECLVPDKKRVRFENNERPSTARGVKPKGRMASNRNGSGAMNIERKMSYGIGGAGNIRRFPLLCLLLCGMERRNDWHGT